MNGQNKIVDLGNSGDETTYDPTLRQKADPVSHALSALNDHAAGKTEEFPEPNPN